MKTIMSTIDGLFHSHKRISYRRLMAFVAATGLLWVERLDSSDWVLVCCAFIAGEAAPKMMAAIKGK